MFIEGKKIILREYSEADWERVHIYGSSSSFTEYEAWGPNSVEDTKAFISDMLVKQTKKPRFEYEFAIIDKESNLLVGGCGFRKDDVQGLVGNLGYAVNPEFQGKGIATEATKMLLQLAFIELGMSVVYATCDADNIASFSVMRKCEMKQVSISKNKRKFKGKIADELRFEITSGEYSD
jgi:[ribosomal protein S5]-alanine N-acetyltransferase